MIGLAGVGFARYYLLVGRPSAAEIEAAVPGELLAWDERESLAVFKLDEGIILDRVVVDRSPHLDFPSLPRWRITGDWYSIPIAPDAVAAAGTRATNGSILLFGQLNSDEVAFVATPLRDGGWERHPVTGRGFVITHVDTSGAAPVRLRLLRADGSEIEEIIAVEASG